MNLEDNLRDRLETVETPASRVDVEMLVDAGRRRAFRRRAAEAAGGVVLVAAVLLAVPLVLNSAKADPVPPGVAPSSVPAPPPATAPPTTAPAGRDTTCAMEKLPVPAGMKDVSADAVDPTGRYIAGNNLVGQNYRAILWTDGQPLALPVRGESVQATAVNASGVVVGLVSEGSDSYAVRYHDGALTRLRTPAGQWNIYPTPAINAAGDVVINAKAKGNSGGDGNIVLIWKAGTTTASRLPLPAGAAVHGINDDGTLVGGVYRNGMGTDAYAWDQQGKARRLERSPGAQSATAYAVAGDWATGGVWQNGNPRTVVWNIRTGAVTKLGTDGPGVAVNSSGWAVMQSGYVVRAGADLGFEVPKGQFGWAKGVSDNGLVVGQTVDEKRDNANLGPRVWRC